MRSYSSQGIILARRNYGEADRVLSVMTDNLGRISLLAKGVRRPKSRKRGHIEVFNLVKFQASEGRGLGLMTEAEVINDYNKLRQDLKKMSVAYFFSEVIGKITREGEPHKELFGLLKDYLEEICTSSNLRQLRSEFTRKALVSVGFWPEGKKMDNPDYILEDVTERKMSSVRVGRKITS
ncbi:MAG TPA: DNA repair protein RecO [Patescibacteria group bacterium]